jgi:hypothetical protein
VNAVLREIDGLTPLPYQRDMVAYLKSMEPEVWAWASSLSVQEQHSNDVRAQLLRDTYRLTHATHPQVYALCEQALQRLQIAAPITVYQANGQSMNATLFYLPGEVHVVLQGPALERLQENELLALLGHELAHYSLWSSHDSDYLVADRVLNHSTSAHISSSSYAESARLYGLHVELYADRGAALVAQSSAVAIAMLVKVHTGIAEVNAEAYLQQALELDEKAGQLSQGTSHPESFLRSQAIDMWWRQDPQLDRWLERRLRGPLSLTRLDLPGQVALTTITRGFIAHYLQRPELRSEKVTTQAQQFFADWQADFPPVDLATLTTEHLDDSVHEYLHYVLLDLALADEDLREPALEQAARIAHTLGSQEGFLKILKRDIKLGKRELTNLTRRAAGGLSQ